MKRIACGVVFLLAPLAGYGAGRSDVADAAARVVSDAKQSLGS